MTYKTIIEKLRTFRKSEDGSITTEFVMIMPVLFFWFIGSVVFFNAYHSKGLAQRSNHTIAEVLSRYTTIDDAFIDELYDLQQQLQPRVSDMNLRVSSVKKCLGVYEVLWSTAVGSPVFDLVDLQDGDVVDSVFPLMAECETLILVETNVAYVPIADWVGIVAQTWATKTVISPRFAAALANTDA